MVRILKARPAKTEGARIGRASTAQGAIRARAAACAIAAAATAGAASTAHAQPDGELKASYEVTIAGIELARANLLVKTQNDLYTAKVGYRTAGVAKAIVTAKGEAMSTGAIKDGKPLPVTYNLDARDDRKSQKVVLAMNAGTIKAMEVEPPTKPQPDRIPIGPEHQKNIVDPLSAILMPVRKLDQKPESVCERSFPVFDGWTRYDVKLSYATSEEGKRDGISGPFVTCSARWIPVAGHKPDAKGTKFMSENKDLSVTLGLASDVGLYIPVKISVRTMVGTVVVDLEKVTRTAQNGAGNQTQAVK